MYEHVREEIGRPAPPRPVQAARTPSPQLPVAAAIAASYQEYESESEDSEAVLDTPGEASHTPHHVHHQQCHIEPPTPPPPFSQLHSALMHTWLNVVSSTKVDRARTGWQPQQAALLALPSGLICMKAKTVSVIFSTASSPFSTGHKVSQFSRHPWTALT